MLTWRYKKKEWKNERKKERKKEREREQEPQRGSVYSNWESDNVESSTDVSESIDKILS